MDGLVFVLYLKNKYEANLKAMEQFENPTIAGLLGYENKAIEKTFERLNKQGIPTVWDIVSAFIEEHVEKPRHCEHRCSEHS